MNYFEITPGLEHISATFVISWCYFLTHDQPTDRIGYNLLDTVHTTPLSSFELGSLNVELDEKCFLTKYDVSGYLHSPASLNIFFEMFVASISIAVWQKFASKVLNIFRLSA